MDYKNNVQKLNGVMKMANNSFINTVQIGVPLTPSVIKNTFENKGFEITLSYGGGMGGSREVLNVITDITEDMLRSDYFTCQTIYGKTITVFTKFIVKVEKVTYVTIQGEHSNSNFIERGSKFVCVNRIYEHNNYVIVNKYDDNENRVVYRQFFN
jgi:hypothetical protein